MHYECISCILLPLCVSFVSLSSDSPTPFQNLTYCHLLLLLLKKSHSESAEAIIPASVVPEKMCSKGWTIFKVIHPHSGTEVALQPACGNGLPFDLAFRQQKARRKTLLDAFPPNCSTGSRAKKQITSYMKRQGSGSHHASQRYSQFLIHSRFPQGFWPSQGAASKFGVGSLVWYLQRVIWGPKCTIRLLQMLVIRVLAV